MNSAFAKYWLFILDMARISENAFKKSCSQTGGGPGEDPPKGKVLRVLGCSIVRLLYLVAKQALPFLEDVIF